MNSSKRSQPSYFLLNRYNGADLLLLFKEGLSIRRSNKDFLLSLVNTLIH